MGLTVASVSFRGIYRGLRKGVGFGVIYRGLSKGSGLRV